MTTDSCSQILESMIPYGGTVVFDWDNTLKLYDKATRQITPRVAHYSLQKWKRDKRCEMYVISAIRPSKMNMETLLFEVNKLGLLDVFTDDSDVIEIVSGKYARKGNIVICGYDKAEVFLELSGQKSQACDDLETDGPPTDEDDCASTSGKSRGDMVDSPMPATHSRTFAGQTSSPRSDVVFFDDEEVNITNFSSLVANSVCYLVT